MKKINNPPPLPLNKGPWQVLCLAIFLLIAGIAFIYTHEPVDFSFGGGTFSGSPGEIHYSLKGLRLLGGGCLVCSAGLVGVYVYLVKKIQRGE